MRTSESPLPMHRIATVWLLLGALLATGCASPLATSGYLSGSRKQDTVVQAADKTPTGDDPRSVSLRKALGEKPVTQEQAFAGVLEQLQEIRAIDPEAERELMADLKE